MTNAIPKFIGSWTNAAGCPATSLAEYAMVGRSNAGKSSLINMMTGFGKLARTSNTPGRTRAINMFEWGNVMLVDLPGYGFAQASKSDARAWDETLNDYLARRQNLRGVLLLIDSRRGIMPSDMAAMDAFDKMGAPYKIVMTKTDKVGKTELENVIKATSEFIKKRPAAQAGIIATSAAKKTGREELIAHIGLA